MVEKAMKSKTHTMIVLSVVRGLRMVKLNLVSEYDSKWFVELNHVSIISDVDKKGICSNMVLTVLLSIKDDLPKTWLIRVVEITHLSNHLFYGLSETVVIIHGKSIFLYYSVVGHANRPSANQHLSRYTTQ